MKSIHKLSGDRNQCGSCGLYFNSSAAFDKHRVVNTRCLTVEEMKDKGMVLGADDFWRGSAMPEGYVWPKNAVSNPPKPT